MEPQSAAQIATQAFVFLSIVIGHICLAIQALTALYAIGAKPHSLATSLRPLLAIVALLVVSALMFLSLVVWRPLSLWWQLAYSAALWWVFLELQHGFLAVLSGLRSVLIHHNARATQQR